jgi:hypothetical protein
MDTDKNNVKHEEPIIGRVDKPGDKYKEEQNTADISHVDRQEGTMNHGNKGGNFNENDSSETKQPD